MSLDLMGILPVPLFTPVVNRAPETGEAAAAPAKTPVSSTNSIWAVEAEPPVHSAARITTVCDLAYHLARQERLEDAFQAIVTGALALAPGDAAVLYVAVPNEPILMSFAAAGLHARSLFGISLRSGEGVSGQAARTQSPIANAPAALDFSSLISRDGTTGFPERTDLSYATAIPVMHGPETLAVLTVYTRAGGHLTSHDQNALKTIAAYAAGAIRKRRPQSAGVSVVRAQGFLRRTLVR